MLGYVLKRLIWFVPTLFFVTLFSFLLLANSSGDPVDTYIQYSGSGNSKTTDYEFQKNYWRQELGLNLPLFYFSIKADDNGGDRLDMHMKPHGAAC